VLIAAGRTPEAVLFVFCNSVSKDEGYISLRDGAKELDLYCPAAILCRMRYSGRIKNEGDLIIMDKYQDIALSLLRIMTGFLFMPHGAQKLFGAFGSEPVELVSLRGLAGVLEFFGGLLILIGLFTRPVAFVLSGMMAAAFFMAHFPRGFWPILNGGELAALYCFVYLYLATKGGGDWSADALLRKKRAA
jgi:putative oxidoreductase